jgi:hypothetical protein
MMLNVQVVAAEKATKGGLHEKLTRETDKYKKK